MIKVVFFSKDPFESKLCLNIVFFPHNLFCEVHQFLEFLHTCRKAKLPISYVTVRMALSDRLVSPFSFKYVLGMYKLQSAYLWNSLEQSPLPCGVGFKPSDSLLKRMMFGHSHALST